MVTLSFLLLFTAFEMLYLSAKQNRKCIKRRWQQTIAESPLVSRIAASALIMLSMVSFVVVFGTASGCIACVIGLMCAGCLVVLLQPFNYLRMVHIGSLFFLFFLLETFV
ncbi:hypothetical protein INP83_11950 [Mucilaginibacter sp. 21P]|uniref:hypothetical protein n=1 Tax=Mucilaginibacter sp. 21P TaxID=2778902 RepID=UPI001C5820B4|nr:hypothetical protein [Mucilaginibacter sp. 21P]QXV63819.1 hypothetical protein INP83_11950 [Mucilaginibacter sp. 21P]